MVWHLPINMKKDYAQVISSKQFFKTLTVSHSNLSVTSKPSVFSNMSKKNLHHEASLTKGDRNYYHFYPQHTGIWLKKNTSSYQMLNKGCALRKLTGRIHFLEKINNTSPSSASWSLLPRAFICFVIKTFFKKSPHQELWILIIRGHSHFQDSRDRKRGRDHP